MAKIVSLVLSASLVIATGMLADIFELPGWLTFLSVICLIYSLFVVICNLFTSKELGRILNTTCRLLTAIVAVLLCALVIVRVHSYGIPYEITENISGINLTRLEDIVADGDEYLIYIGREDCGECEIFENDLNKYLKEYQVGLYGYYTNKDRDGERKEEMYKLLDELNVIAVPALIEIEDNKAAQVDIDDEFAIENAIERYYGHQ